MAWSDRRGTGRRIAALLRASGAKAAKLLQRTVKAAKLLANKQIDKVSYDGMC